MSAASSVETRTSSAPCGRGLVVRVPGSAARGCLRLLIDHDDLDRNCAAQPARHVLTEPARDPGRQGGEDDLADIAAAQGIAHGSYRIAVADLTGGLDAARAEGDEECLET